MNTITIDIPGFPVGLLARYLATPTSKRESFLENEDWYKNLPDDRNYKCQYCQDKGFIEDSAGGARKCKCTVGLDEHKDNINLTNEYIEMDLLIKKQGWENWPLPSIKKIQQHHEYVVTESIKGAIWLISALDEKSQGRGLILYGANGRGKTMAGLLVLKHQALLKKKCLAIRYREIINLIKGGIDSSKKKLNMMDRIFASDAVLIDELGKEDTGGNVDHGKQLAEEIISEFFSKKKTLIITSNMTREMLREYFSTSTMSRLKSPANWCTIIEEPAESKDLRGSGIEKSN